MSRCARSSFTALTLAVLAACRDVTAPLPSGAARFEPPSIYARWWSLTSTCASRPDDFRAYSWYVTPGSSIATKQWGDVRALTDVAAHRVVIAAAWTNHGPTVRHEMLHALLGKEYASDDNAKMHPPAFFQGACSGVVSCTIGCSDAGPPPVDAPANAPALSLSALDLRVELLANPVSRTGADSVLSIVVRATNPTAQAMRVPLDLTVVNLPFGQVLWYGFRIVPFGDPVPITVSTVNDSAGIVTSEALTDVPFAAGQTRWWTIDLRAATFAPGEYRAVGMLNSRQAWAPLTVRP